MGGSCDGAFTGILGPLHRMGAVALLDDLDFLPSGHPGRTKLSDMAARLLEAVCAFQSDEGRWYQVVDKGRKSR